MAAPVASCVADAQCRPGDAASARREVPTSWTGIVQEIPSWEAVVEAIRAQADEQDAEAAEDLNLWADFVEACAELRRQSRR
jgi:hypothetical protein